MADTTGTAAAAPNPQPQAPPPEVFKACYWGDDEVCKDFFGDDLNEGTEFCCWRYEILKIPGDDEY